MTLRQNDWTLGTYCQTYCRVVTMHHSIEDQAMYPRLRPPTRPRPRPGPDGRGAPPSTAGSRTDRALVGLVADPDTGVAGVRRLAH